MSHLNINDFLAGSAEIEAPKSITKAPIAHPLPEIINNRYKIRRIAGIGGMGIVYEVSDLLLTSLNISSDRLAIKVLNAEAHQYNDAQCILINEYTQTRKLHHPNILPIQKIELCNKTDNTFLLMPLIQGDLLSILLDSPMSHISNAERVNYAIQLINAVSHCHNSSVIHGDIKPGNILISKEGHLFLFDFGISRNLNEKENQFAIDFNKVHAWSGNFSAPEVINGQTSTIKSDLFSLSILIYKLLFNIHPYQQEHLINRSTNKTLANIQQILLQGMTPKEQDRTLGFQQLKKELYRLQSR